MRILTATLNPKLLLLLLMILYLPASNAVVEVHDFDSELTRQRYLELIEELRCPKCQNQNLAGSDSPIAADLRRELRRLLDEGKSDTEIVDFMVARYGEYVLYRPRVNSGTWLLWGLPVLLLLAGGMVIALMVRRRSGVNEQAVVDGSESERLENLLKQAKSVGNRVDEEKE